MDTGLRPAAPKTGQQRDSSGATWDSNATWDSEQPWDGHAGPTKAVLGLGQPRLQTEPDIA